MTRPELVVLGVLTDSVDTPEAEFADGASPET